MKCIAAALGVVSLLSVYPSAAEELDGEWRGSATVASSKSSGNTNSSVVSAKVDESSGTEGGKWSLYGSVMYGYSQGVKNNDKARLGARRDHNLGEKNFAYALGELERDSISDLALRGTLGSGLGHHMIRSEETTFDVMAGLAYSKARYIVAPPQGNFELMLAEESKHTISDQSHWKQKWTVYTNLKTGGQYRSVFDTSYVVDITDTIGLSLGLQHKYNTDVPATAKRSDATILTGFSFKL